MNITKKLFGKTNGEDVYAYTVGDGDLEAVFLTFGDRKSTRLNSSHTS